MLLELKKIKDHLQFQLRKLLREARKADLDIYCLSTGYLEEKLQFSQANVQQRESHLGPGKYQEIRPHA